MNNFAEKVIRFYQTIQLPREKPEGIEVMHAHIISEVAKVSSEFYRKFYADDQPEHSL